MGLETGNGCVTLSAGITYIGFLSVVYVSVEFHVNPLGVDLTASGTTVGFFPGVQPEVGFQVRGGTEPLSALLAFMRFFAYLKKEKEILIEMSYNFFSN